jgi:Zn-dependent protease with chaperone function
MVNELFTLKLGRKQETEADLKGLLLLQRIQRGSQLIGGH